MKACVHITLKDGVLDPQGKAIAHALETLGFRGVSGVRQGKYIEIDLDGGDESAVRSQVNAMCEQLLANTVIEDFTVDIAK